MRTMGTHHHRRATTQTTPPNIRSGPGDGDGAAVRLCVIFKWRGVAYAVCRSHPVPCYCQLDSRMYFFPTVLGEGRSNLRLAIVNSSWAWVTVGCHLASKLFAYYKCDQRNQKNNVLLFKFCVRLFKNPESKTLRKINLHFLYSTLKNIDFRCILLGSYENCIIFHNYITLMNLNSKNLLYYFDLIHFVPTFFYISCTAQRLPNRWPWGITIRRDL